MDPVLLLRQVDDVRETAQVDGRPVRDPDEVRLAEILGLLAEPRELRAQDPLAGLSELVHEDRPGPLEQRLRLAQGIRGREEFFHLLAFPVDRKSTRLNSSHVSISYAVFCLKK